MYVGNTAKKFLVYEEEKLRALKFFDLGHGELPDIVAYSQGKNWLFLIEAFHSTGPISSIRLVELQRLAAECLADIVYVTAFLDRISFRKHASEIAWETEVWIADAPDHLVHFNGDKFLGPYRVGE